MMPGRLPTVVLLVSALLLPGCARTAVSPAPSPAPSIARESGPVDLIYARTRRNLADGPRLSIIDAATGKQVRDLPLGVIAPDWSAMYTLDHPSGVIGATAVHALALPSGQPTGEATLKGLYELQYMQPSEIPVGLSPNGRWLALYTTTDRLKTRYVVLDTAFRERPRTIDLDGIYYFAALSADGSLLFLSEVMGATPDAISRPRVADLAQGVLRPRDGAAAVGRGWRVESIAAPDRRTTYALHVTGAGAYVNAVDGALGLASRITLPDSSWHWGWSFGMTADGRLLYAGNSGIGTLVEIDAAQRRILRQVSLPKKRAGILERLLNAAIPVASAKVPLESRGAVLAPDGQTLYVAGEAELLAIDTRDLSVRRSYLAGYTLDGLVIAPDGKRVYALSVSGLHGVEHTGLLRLDLTTGTVIQVPTEVLPFVLLHVETAR